MQVTIDIPDSVAEQMTKSGLSPQQAILQVLALAGYRNRQLSEYQVQLMLGLESRFDLHAFLKDHNNYLNYSIEDFEKDMETIRCVRAAEDAHAT